MNPFIKRKTTNTTSPQPQTIDVAGSILGVTKLFTDMQELKNDVVTTVDNKINEVTARVQALDDIMTPAIEELRKATDGIEQLKEDALDIIEDIKQGEKGDAGKDADEESMRSDLAKEVEQVEKRLKDCIPVIDEKKLIEKLLKQLPENKASLKIIQEQMAVEDPESIIDRIMALPEEKRAKLRVAGANIDGLAQTIRSMRTQLGNGYQHGGGDTVVAGTNVTIATNANGQKIINAAGGGGGTVGPGTINELAYFDSTTTVTSLTVATYPSLTEFSYGKGVTSAIQTQLNAKLTANAPITGATKTKITYDVNGLITVGADATTSDIAEGSNLYFTEARVRATPLTGLSVTGSTITSTDTILQALGKAQNQINAVLGGVNYQGTWNATTNTPTIVSSTGTKGHYYVVSVAGSTSINGITDWKLGDWIIFNGSTWEKVDNTDAVISVNGYTGAVTLVTTDIAEGSNLYYTDTRARAAITGTTNRVTVTTGVVDIAGSYVGQASITTLGTITTGTWTGTAIASANIAAALTSKSVNGVTLVNGGTATKYLSEDGTYTTPAGSSGWSLTGNASTSPGTDYIGTSDNQDVIIKRNNVNQIQITGGGDNFIIGDSSATWYWSTDASMGHNTASAATVAIGSDVGYGGATRNVNVMVGTGTGTLNLATGLTGAKTVNVGATDSTGTISIGRSTVSNTISIGNADTATGDTQTINIGAGTPTGTGKATITIGNNIAATAVAYIAGTGGHTFTGTVVLSRLVEANTAVAASPNIITSAESFTVFTNEGATAVNYHTLPTAVAGLQYTFTVQDADGIRVVADAGDTIRVAGVVSGVAGYAESLTRGSVVTLLAINATEWTAVSTLGTWSVV